LFANGQTRVKNSGKLAEYGEKLVKILKRVKNCSQTGQKYLKKVVGENLIEKIKKWSQTVKNCDK
jgi:hypothetical protein